MKHASLAGIEGLRLRLEPIFVVGEIRLRVGDQVGQSGLSVESGVVMILGLHNFLLHPCVVDHVVDARYILVYVLSVVLIRDLLLYTLIIFLHDLLVEASHFGYLV